MNNMLIYLITLLALFAFSCKRAVSLLSLEILARGDEIETHLDRNVSNIRSKNLTNSMHRTKVIDFAIIGFPKCSTTFLRNGLINTPQFFYGNNDTEIFLNHFENKNEFVKLYKNVSTNPDIKKGFKCPEVLYSKSTLSILEHDFPRTDFIISVRHPVLWFQTFYNYRLRKGYDMPPPDELIAKCPNLGEGVLDESNQNKISKSHKVCTDRANFHMALSRLGKTPMDTKEEMDLLRNHNLSVHHFPNRIFLMEIGQLSVDNRTRADQFVDDLGDFLHLNSRKDDLSHSLPRLKKHIAQHKVAKKVNSKRLSKKLLDICSPSHDKLRSTLLQTGREASSWIRKYFINSPDVVISHEQHFIKLLERWEHDPCPNEQKE
jgi:hypothetical protein